MSDIWTNTGDDSFVDTGTDAFINNTAIGIYTIFVSDSIAVSESIAFKFSLLNISVVDSITVTESNTVQQITFLGTDPRPSHIPKLPTAKGSATFSESFVVTGNIPTVSCVGYFGSVVESNAPTPSAEIALQGLFAGYISVSSKVPVTEGEGRFGSKTTGKVATVSCNAVLSGNTITVSGYAPVVTAEIEIPNYFISVIGNSPFPLIEAELTTAAYITISGTAPPVYGNAVITKAGLIDITGISPVAKAEYNAIQVGSSSIVITGTAPVVATYQPTGEEDPGGITLSKGDRFSDITLQYSRWPDAV